jgi:hypothetical protein
LFKEFPRKFQVSNFQVERCLLLCGAEASYLLVKYVIKARNVSIIDLLSFETYRNDHGENALHIAIKNGRNDVIDYLLKDWVHIPVETLQLSEDLTLRMLSLVIGRRDQIVVYAFGHF